MGYRPDLITKSDYGNDRELANEWKGNGQNRKGQGRNGLRECEQNFFGQGKRSRRIGRRNGAGNKKNAASGPHNLAI